MASWRIAAVLTVFGVAAFVGGAAVRLFDAVDDPAITVSVGILGIVVIVAVAIGTRSRRLSTPYW